MRWWRDVGCWLRARPMVADALLGLLIAPPAVWIPIETPAGPLRQSVAAQVLALFGCVLLTVRRRQPVVVWLLTLVAAVAAAVWQSGPSGAVLPMLVALFTVAVRAETGPAALFGVGSGALLLAVAVVAAPSRWASPTTYVAATWCGLATALGLAVRNQRQVVSQARERARIAEESREEEAQRRVSEERLRIARELHDVVAHHIAVINVQSGVAEHLMDSAPARAKEAIEHVRAATGEVLEEMATLLGVLRTGGDEAAREPARGLGELDTLVDSLRRTGLHVSARREGAPVQLAPLVDVTAYRVLEEALTNVHKHGGGAAAELRVAQQGRTTVLEVRNRLAAAALGAWSPGRGGGHGLIGMRERVAAVGGVMQAGPDDGWFVVRAELPTVVPVNDVAPGAEHASGGTVPGADGAP